MSQHFKMFTDKKNPNPLKNAQNAFKIEKSYTFFQSQTVLLQFTTLYYSNLLKFLTNWEHLKKYTQTLSINLENLVILPETTIVYTIATEDACDI